MIKNQKNENKRSLGLGLGDVFISNAVWQVFFCTVLVIVTMFVMGVSIEALLTCAFFICLVRVAKYDYTYMIIPNIHIIFLTVIGIVNVVLHINGLKDYLLGAVSISALLLAAYFVTGKKGIGGGDIKLTFAAGLMLGLNGTVAAFLIGSLAALLFWLVSLLRFKSGSEGRVFAYGPFLAAGIIVTKLFTVCYYG